jgi:hypothetical protein
MPKILKKNTKTAVKIFLPTNKCLVSIISPRSHLNR